MPKVVHCRRAPAGSFVLCDRTTKFGNPFVIGIDGDRDEVCDLFEAWFPTQSHLVAAPPELKGHDLGCWCAPKRCHCDYLLRRANEDQALM